MVLPLLCIILLLLFSFVMGKSSTDRSVKHEAYLLFPVHLDGTLLDNAQTMKAKKEFFSTLDVLEIFRQVMTTRYCFIVVTFEFSLLFMKFS